MFPAAHATGLHEVDCGILDARVTVAGSIVPRPGSSLVLVPHPVSATESRPISTNEGTTLLDRAFDEVTGASGG